jgi:hypothetical protein
VQRAEAHQETVDMMGPADAPNPETMSLALEIVERAGFVVTEIAETCDTAKVSSMCNELMDVIERHRPASNGDVLLALATVFQEGFREADQIVFEIFAEAFKMTAASMRDHLAGEDDDSLVDDILKTMAGAPSSVQ